MNSSTLTASDGSAASCSMGARPFPLPGQQCDPGSPPRTSPTKKSYVRMAAAAAHIWSVTTPPERQAKMTSQNAPGNRPANSAITIEIAGLDLNFKVARIADSTPTGAQIAAAAEVLPD